MREPFNPPRLTWVIYPGEKNMKLSDFVVIHVDYVYMAPDDRQSRLEALAKLLKG